MRNEKGCKFADIPNSGTDSEEMLVGYSDPDLAIMTGCPIETAKKYPYLYDFCVSVSNSTNYYLPNMSIVQATAYDAFVLDRNIVQEQRYKNRNKE